MIGQLRITDCRSSQRCAAEIRHRLNGLQAGILPAERALERHLRHQEAGSELVGFLLVGIGGHEAGVGRVGAILRKDVIEMAF
jgi:hypothetical protein